MFLDQMNEHNQVKGNFPTAIKLKNNTNQFQGWSKTVRLYQPKPGSILVLVLFNLNTIMVLFGSLTPPGFICDPVQLWCRRRNYKESRYLSLGNQRSAGLQPKETRSAGPRWQLDQDSVGVAEAPVWEMQKHRHLRMENTSGPDWCKRKSVHVKHLVIARCIHAAVTRSAAWEATATALTTPPRAASTVVGGRSAAIGMQCAAPATAAVTVSRMDLPSCPNLQLEIRTVRTSLNQWMPRTFSTQTGPHSRYVFPNSMTKKLKLLSYCSD